MKATLIAIALMFCLVGCKPPVDETSNNSTPPVGVTKSASGGSAGTTGTGAAVSGTSGGGVAPMAAGAGGMTPMSGTDSVTGAGGGGVEQAAKKMAKDKAAKAGSGSLEQGLKDESGQ